MIGKERKRRENGAFIATTVKRAKYFLSENAATLADNSGSFTKTATI